MPNCCITRRWILVYVLFFLRFEFLRLVWDFPSWRVAAFLMPRHRLCNGTVVPV